VITVSPPCAGNCRLFAGLADVTHQLLCRYVGILECAKGKMVYRQGSNGNTFHMILAGSVSVYLDRMPTLDETVLKTQASFRAKGRYVSGRTLRARVACTSPRTLSPRGWWPGF